MRHVEQVSLDSQRSQIQHLLEEKAKAEARLEVLEREHAAVKRSQEDSLLADVLVPPEQNSATTFQPPPLEPGLMISMIGLPPTSFLDASPRVNATPMPEEFEITANIHERITTEQNVSSNTVVSRETDADAQALRTTYSSDDDSEPEDIMITLHDDYTACLRQLKTLQSSLEMALNKMFIPTVGVPAANPDHDIVARKKLARRVESSLRKTYDCFDQKFLGPSAHREILEQGWSDSGVLFRLGSLKHGSSRSKKDDLCFKLPRRPSSSSILSDKSAEGGLPDTKPKAQSYTDRSSQSKGLVGSKRGSYRGPQPQDSGGPSKKWQIGPSGDLSSDSDVPSSRHSEKIATVTQPTSDSPDQAKDSLGSHNMESLAYPPDTMNTSMEYFAYGPDLLSDQASFQALADELLFEAYSTKSSSDVKFHSRSRSEDTIVAPVGETFCNSSPRVSVQGARSGGPGGNTQVVQFESHVDRKPLRHP
jgi:hypothetical protein